jgi:hypothetical protein
MYVPTVLRASACAHLNLRVERLVILFQVPAAAAAAAAAIIMIGRDVTTEWAAIVSIPSRKPGLHARRVEHMQAWEPHHLQRTHTNQRVSTQQSANRSHLSSTGSSTIRATRFATRSRWR